MSCKKWLKAKQAECAYSKCRNVEVIGIEKVYECKNDDKPQIDLQLNPYECAIIKDFELYIVHVESAEI